MASAGSKGNRKRTDAIGERNSINEVFVGILPLSLQISASTSKFDKRSLSIYAIVLAL